LVIQKEIGHKRILKLSQSKAKTSSIKNILYNRIGYAVILS